MLGQEVILDIEQLAELCDYWQDILRLQDWDIHLRVARQTEMGMENAQGACSYQMCSGTAFISILDPIDYVGNLPQDMEHTLVHELIHLHFATFDETVDYERPEGMYLERAIERITEALLFMRRELIKKEEPKSGRKKRVQKVQE